MKIDSYNKKLEKTKKLSIPESVFGLQENNDLLWQVIKSMRENKRTGTAHTKNRGEVSGSRRKPWPQKGTGRARHGDRYSPLWRKGGKSFGPRNEKKYGTKIPKKMKRKALLVALSSKVKDNELIILEEIKIEKAKTKLMAQWMNSLRKKKELGEKSVLIVLPEKNEKVERAVRNLPKTSSIEARNLNALEVLRFKYLVMPEKSIKVIKEVFTL